MILSPVKMGKAAELLFAAECLIHGLNCFMPVTEDGRVDVILGDNLLKVQVKVITQSSHSLSVRKVGCNSRSNVKIYNYSSSDIDFFVGVDLSTRDVYIVPQTVWTQYRRSISISMLESLGLKNNFGLLTSVLVPNASDEIGLAFH